MFVYVESTKPTSTLLELINELSKVVEYKNKQKSIVFLYTGYSSFVKLLSWDNSVSEWHRQHRVPNILLVRGTLAELRS